MPHVSLAASSCTSDDECKTSHDYTLGCYDKVQGLTRTWYCINVHPEDTACTSDAECTPNDLTYNPNVVGCYNTANHWKCRITYTPGEGIAPSTNNKNQNILCDGSTGISTAIGCIHALGDENAFLNDLLKWAVGIGSGIAFILMLVSGFMIMTAQGNPERLKAGQELLTSAIAGLILLIFSVFILKFIGIDILGLGKFGFGK